MKTLNNSHKYQDFSLLVKYHAATTHKGAKVSITSKRFKKKLSFSLDYEFNSALDQVSNFLFDNKINVLSYSEFGNDSIIMIKWDDGLKLMGVK